MDASNKSVQTGPEVHPAFCLIGTREFSPEVKWLRCEADYPYSCSADIKNERSCNSTSTYAFVACRGTFLLYLVVGRKHRV
jgi:hypothetical protein